MLNGLTNSPEPHIPDKLPFDYTHIVSEPEIMKLVIQANNSIGKYDGFLHSLMNPMLLISPLISQEAVLSSKLEGTHATLEDVLNYEAGNKVEIETDEIQEIINYRRSLFHALDRVSTYSKLNDKNERMPLTVRVIKEMHKILLDNVRGSSKQPGQFKKSQNYIGSKQKINFTPLPASLTDDYMSNLEKYIHYEDLDLIVQSAIIHAQFEMIHPFQDGNGRIGRLLIPLFLYYREQLKYPTFYMSAYFEKDRSLYISHLSNISKKRDWASWIKYYLQGVIESAEESTDKAQKILILYDHMKTEIIPQLNSASGIELLDFIFSTPIFSAAQVDENLVYLAEQYILCLIKWLILSF